MDIYCTNCGASWGVGSDPIEDVNAARKGKCWECDGDPKLRDAFGTRHRVNGLSRADATQALSDVLGDDVDGIASMLDDYGF
jgi:hypothetical protein